MREIGDNEIDLVITSPPYWQIKDYGQSDQIGYRQTLHEYLYDLYRVWNECFRVLRPGRRLCINIGDQFARASVYGRYKIIPLHSECISQCENIGFDYMGSIIWRKKTTINTTGGAAIMGSYPYPPNGMIEIDYEYILIFKKPGGSLKQDAEIKKKSEITRAEWKEYFSGHWNFGGAKQTGGHQAMFPEELPRRLIKMFSFHGETVLDPFLGSGTTAKAALDLNRNAAGYEINETFISMIKEKIACSGDAVFVRQEPAAIERYITGNGFEARPYISNLKDADYVNDPGEKKLKQNEQLFKVLSIENQDTLVIDTGLRVRFLGIKIDDDKKAAMSAYLEKYILKKLVIIRYDKNHPAHHGDPAVPVYAYVYLKNKIFVNRSLIKSGLAGADWESEYSMKKKFLSLQDDAHQD
jgi:modification methylase